MQDQKTHELLIQLEQAKNTIQYITIELKKRGIDPEKCGYRIYNQNSIDNEKKDEGRSILLSRLKKNKLFN